MSVEKRGKGRWRVRWLQGGQHRSRTFSSFRDAKRFDVEMKSLKLDGRMPSAPRLTLAEFAEEHWFPDRVAHLAPATQVFYRAAWRKHIARQPPASDLAGTVPPAPGSLAAQRLRDISPATVRRFERELRRTTGGAMTRKTLMVLSSCLGYAVAEDHLSANPLAALRQSASRGGPRLASAPHPRALSPAAVERLRVEMLRAPGGQGDALLVALMAYGGLRPGEALALRRSSVRERTVLVDASISFGKEKGTKTGISRHPLALGPLTDDVEEWCSAEGLGETDRLFTRSDGTPWKEHDYRNWRRRVFQPAADAAGLNDGQRKKLTPYALRHSWASLLLRSPEYHADPARIAKMAGHSLQTFFRYYAHEIEEVAGQPPLDPDAAIHGARQAAADELPPL